MLERGPRDITAGSYRSRSLEKAVRGRGAGYSSRKLLKKKSGQGCAREREMQDIAAGLYRNRRLEKAAMESKLGYIYIYIYI